MTYERDVLICPNVRNAYMNFGCPMEITLPICDCGKSAKVRETKRGRLYYCCGKYRSPWCEFKDWDGPKVYKEKSQ